VVRGTTTYLATPPRQHQRAGRRRCHLAGIRAAGRDADQRVAAQAAQQRRPSAGWPTAQSPCRSRRVGAGGLAGSFVVGQAGEQPVASAAQAGIAGAMAVGWGPMLQRGAMPEWPLTATADRHPAAWRPRRRRLISGLHLLVPAAVATRPSYPAAFLRSAGRRAGAPPCEGAPLTETQQGLQPPTHRPGRAGDHPQLQAQGHTPAGWMGRRAAGPQQPGSAAGRSWPGGGAAIAAGHNRATSRPKLTAFGGPGACRGTRGSRRQSRIDRPSKRSSGSRQSPQFPGP